jgi:hypothetical protein
MCCDEITYKPNQLNMQLKQNDITRWELKDLINAAVELRLVSDLLLSPRSF